MPPDFRTHEAEFRRREILQILATDLDYSCNESLLRTMLRERGYNASADQVRGDVAWLAEQGLVRSRELGELVVATALQRGVDVANGATAVPGVARPEPGRV